MDNQNAFQGFNVMNKSFLFIALTFIVMISSEANLISAASYTITKCDEGLYLHPIGDSLYNAGGYAVVYKNAGDGSLQPFTLHPYLDHNGTLTDIGTLGGSTSWLNKVNDNGQVVGSSWIAGDVASHAFLWRNGAMSDLGTLGGTSSEARFINNSGQVAGNSYIAGDQSQHAFVYKNGSMNDLGTCGGNSSSVNGMNESGQIIGTSSLTGDGNSHAFLWSNGSMTDLGALGESYVNSAAIGINSSGQIVGTCSTIIMPPEMRTLDIGWINTRPFLYSNGTMTDINDLVDEPHGIFTAAISIDDSGQIVVSGVVNRGLDYYYTYVLTPVPEPSSLILLTLSVLGWFFFYHGRCRPAVH